MLVSFYTYCLLFSWLVYYIILTHPLPPHTSRRYNTIHPNNNNRSEDGLTFIVKNPNLFETTIIPNFYKHNKFTSFVRQLNFYGFRKVKYSDSLRINHREEKTTKKYWRFKHPNFRKGRQDLLIDIKRQPSVPNGVGGRPPHGSNQYTSHRTASTSTASVQKQSNTTTATNNKTISYSTHQTNQEVHTLKNEMSELKSRVVNMSCNIDLLTNMVQKVTVHDFDGAAAMIGAGVVSLGDQQLGVVVGNKRKKMGNITNNVSYLNQGQDQDDITMPDWNPSSTCYGQGDDPFTLITDGNYDDALLSAEGGGVAADSLPDLTPSSSSAPLPDLAMSTADVMAPSPPKSAAAEHDAAPPSSSSNGGDDNFVDDLFQAFADEESLDDAGLLQEEAAAPSSGTTPTSTGNKNNNVCPKLMKRIEDSLSTIPSEMHELVAKKLIDAISDTKPIVEGASSLFSQGQGGVAAAAAVGAHGDNSHGRRSRSNSGSSEGSFKRTTDRSVSVDESTGASGGASSTTQPSIPLPIAVSALKTILAEYGVKVECKMDGSKAASRRGSSCSKDADPRFKKSSLLPVVPMHA